MTLIKYPIPWELWYYSLLRSCRIFSINGRVPFLAPSTPLFGADGLRCMGSIGFRLRARVEGFSMEGVQLFGVWASGCEVYLWVSRVVVLLGRGS